MHVLMMRPYKHFANFYSLHSLIKQPTCFKNPENPSCIDLILTNKSRSFQSKCVIETGLSDFHRMKISVLKMYFRKLPPKVTNYRDLKKFDNERFIDSLHYNHSEDKIDYSKNPDKFLKLAKMFSTNTHPEKRSIFVGKINLS